MGKDEKTNVMRILEQKKLPYLAHAYPHGPADAIDAVSVARSVGLDAACVFKTLVARGASGQLLVFAIPAAASLDLKKAARAAGEKSVSMLPQRELLGATGYVHGGCSPVGMKKQYPTFFHRSVENLSRVAVSAGRVGLQVELSPADLLALVHGSTAALTVEDEA